MRSCAKLNFSSFMKQCKVHLSPHNPVFGYFTRDFPIKIFRTSCSPTPEQIKRSFTNKQLLQWQAWTEYVSGRLIRFRQDITVTRPNPWTKTTKRAEENPKIRSSTVNIECLKTFYISKNLQKLKMTATVNFKIFKFPWKLVKHALWDAYVRQTWTVTGVKVH